MQAEVKTVRMPLNTCIDEDLASDIEKQSVYVAETVRKLKVVPDGNEVEITCDAEANLDDVLSKVSRFTAAMIRGHRKIEPTIHHARAREMARPYVDNVFGKLQERGWLFEHGQGIVSLAGPALKVYQHLDTTFRELYEPIFKPEDRQFPAMAPASVLARCGYFEMHPNALSFISHLVNDFDEIENFRQANKGKTDGVYLTHAKAFASPHNCLNPAACFVCYQALEGKTLPANGVAMTWTGRVFRYESSNTVGLDRLWEFNVRELVFLGGEKYVMDARTKSVELVKQLFERWNLDAQIETATDPFFATVHAARTFWQRSMDVKYEIKLPLAPREDGKARNFAVGSINIHGPFFGDRFKISTDAGESAHTGCVGFGLERWVLALFTQHGFDVNDWPQEFASAFSKA